MTEARCGRCGEPILYEVGQVSVGCVLVCPSCATRVQVKRMSDAGVETEPVATASSGALTASGGASGAAAMGAMDPYRTGTIVLQADPALEPNPNVEVKVKGFLTREGVSSEEADIRLRGGLTVIGRVHGDVLIDDSAVSSRHFQVEEKGSEFYVRDLDSSNGTFLNGRMVRFAKLNTGDRIEVGTSVFTFSVRHSIPT